jgi:ATP/maltotriose-dependent transcriptional regulator MalT
MLRWGGTETATFMLATGVLLYAERIDAFDRALAEAFADAHRRGSVLGFAFASLLRSYGALLQGRLADAEDDALRALEIMREHPWAVVLLIGVGYRADALAQQGRLDEAQAALDEAGFGGEVPPFSPFAAMLDIRGRLRLAQGRPEEALADLLECGRRAEPGDPANPAVIAWRSHAAEAHVALGDSDAARALADEELALARSYGASRPIGAALRVAGLAAGGEEGIALLDEAVTTLEGSIARLELARALTDLGAAVRRAGRRAEAVVHLRRGMDLAHACGGGQVAARARDELVATGARPRRAALKGPDALTPAERRVASLAVEGMSNRAIEQSLFVTQRTVELHLTRAYAKLGVRSRAELPGAMAG